MAQENKSPETTINLENSTVGRNQPIEGGNQAIVVNKLQVTSVIRTPQDIGKWRTAHVAAESVYSPNRTYLYDIYSDSLLDPILSGTMRKRMESVLNKDIILRSKNKDVIDTFNSTLKSRNFRKIIEIILESVYWGISGIEFIPGKEFRFNTIPRKHIKTKTQIIALQQNNLYNGIDYTKLDNVWIIGDDDNLGILLQATAYVIYKRNAMADWANFIEIFGQPIRIAKYDVHDADTQQALKETLDQAGSALSLMIPKTAEFDIQDGKTSNANGDLQANFLKYIDEQLQILILGNTETTSGQKSGSRAKAAVQQNQQSELIKSDMDLVISHLNCSHFRNILKSYGFNIPDGAYFEYTKEIDIDMLTKRIEIDSKLAALINIPPSYFYETYGIEAPANAQEAANPPEAKPAQEPTPNPEIQKQLSDISNKLKDFFG